MGLTWWVVMAASGCWDAPVALDPSVPEQPELEGAEPERAVLVGAGDIAVCDGDGDERTAALLDSIPGTIFTTGDHAYANGTAAEFQSCYEPSWGRHRARTRPSPGNHDYDTPEAQGYFDYFGDLAGDPGKGYYSYELGSWLILSLNSSVDMSPASEQVEWLRSTLQANHRSCTLAYWHHPLYSSGHHGDEPSVAPLWDVLYDLGADVVLNGHEHSYERFAPMRPDGSADPARGLHQMVVGTGGIELRPFGPPKPGSLVRYDASHGVLKLTLGEGRFDWEFVPTDGAQTPDAGTATCH